MARTRLPIVLTALLAPPLAFAGAPSDLDSLVRERLDALSAQSTLYARHLPTGRTIAVRADEPMNTVSVIKLPIMVLAYRDAEAGRLDFDERYVIRLEDLRRGTGLLQTFAPGLAPTWRDLVAQMIITSDNTATDILIGRLGQDRVNEMLTDFPSGSAFVPRSGTRQATGRRSSATTWGSCTRRAGRS